MSVLTSRFLFVYTILTGFHCAHFNYFPMFFILINSFSKLVWSILKYPFHFGGFFVLLCD